MDKKIIAQIVSAWNIKPYSIKPFNRGMVNENFLIKSDTNKYVIRKLGFLKSLIGSIGSLTIFYISINRNLIIKFQLC
ncbi:MAG: hypothetical protein ACP5RQ_03260 [Candidatus Micrarchaeia archaeon]